MDSPDPDGWLDAIRWLLERDHEEVHVLISVDHREQSALVVKAQGKLACWPDQAAPVEVTGLDDLAGKYTVGDMSIDVTDLEGLPVVFGDIGDSITFALTGGVRLTIVRIQPLF